MSVYISRYTIKQIMLDRGGEASNPLVSLPRENAFQWLLNPRIKLIRIDTSGAMYRQVWRLSNSLVYAAFSCDHANIYDAIAHPRLLPMVIVSKMPILATSVPHVQCQK